MQRLVNTFRCYMEHPQESNEFAYEMSNLLKMWGIPVSGYNPEHTEFCGYEYDISVTEVGNGKYKFEIYEEV